MGCVLCEHCTAACCRYVAVPIDAPTTARDFNDMRWYVLHENIAVFIEEGEWFIQFHTPCQEIEPDGRCGIYETRPTICREYTTKECDYHVGDPESAPSYFDNPEDLAVFAREFLRKRRARSNGRASRSKTPKRTSGKSPRRIPRGVRSGGAGLVQLSLSSARK